MPSHTNPVPNNIPLQLSRVGARIVARRCIPFRRIASAVLVVAHGGLVESCAPAVSVVEGANQVLPECYRLHNSAFYGGVYLRNHELDRAIQEYDQVLRCTPNPSATDVEVVTAYVNRAIAYFDKGDYNHAIQDLSEAIRLVPSAVHYYDRGVVYQAKGDNDRAIQDFDQAIRLNPNDAHAFSKRGEVYQALGDNDRAIQDFKEAIRLDPTLS